jgi:hypothetical protein
VSFGCSASEAFRHADMAASSSGWHVAHLRARLWLCEGGRFRCSVACGCCVSIWGQGAVMQCTQRTHSPLRQVRPQHGREAVAAAHPVPGDHRGCAATKFAAQAASTSLQWYRPAIPNTAKQAASPSLMPSRFVTQRDQSCSTSAGLAARAAPVSLEAQCCELGVHSGGAGLCLGVLGRVAGCCATCAC